MKKLSFLTPTEKIVFRLGFCLFMVEVILLIISLAVYPELFKKIMAVIVASLVGGRLACILTGMELEFVPFSLVILLFTFNTIWLLMVYPLIASFYSNLVEIKTVNKMLVSTGRMAERQRDVVMKIGRLGLPLFVWLPFPWTGAVVGSVVGLLMGMSTIRILSVVIPAMLIGIISWTYGFEYLLIVTGPTGKVVSISLVGIIVILSLLSRFRLLHKS